jgi:hypothetical protein
MIGHEKTHGKLQVMGRKLKDWIQRSTKCPGYDANDRIHGFGANPMLIASAIN